jgi:hypothetical protein
VSVRQWRLNDYYAVLGVSPRASDQEIDLAFRDLAKRWHPDRCAGDGDAAERFKEITAAHDVIGDPHTRAAYDRERALGPTAPRARAAAPASRGAAPPSWEEPGSRSGQPPTWEPVVAAARPTRRPRHFHPLLVLSIGVVLLAGGLLLGVWRLTVGRAGSSFGSAATHTSGVIVDMSGRRAVQFRTAAGVVVTSRPSGRATDAFGTNVDVVYDRREPSRVVLDHDSFAKEITIWFAAVKLVVGGIILMIVSRSQRLRRWLVDHARAQRRPMASTPVTRAGA